MLRKTFYLIILSLVVVKSELQTLESEFGDQSFPFKLCSNAPTNLKVKTLYLTPDPPQKDSTLLIQSNVIVDEQLTNGSTFQVSVYYLGIKIYTKQVDMSKAVSLPAGPGAITFQYSVSVPSKAPTGAYKVKMMFKDQTEIEIGCINVSFSL